jgi:hypothetical protein
MVLGSFVFVLACGDDSMVDEMDAGDRMDAFVGMDADMEEDAGMMGVDAPGVDTGPDLRRELLDALGESSWSSLQARDEGGTLRERAYEMIFRAGSLEWVEVRNPFGPARLRTLRNMNVLRDGVTVETTILSPGGWPPHPRNGATESWAFEIVPGSPRMLEITSDETGFTETFVEGAWPEPEGGLTAEVRVFGPSGAIYDAFCDSASFNRQVIWSYARGASAEPVLGHDVVAGARIHEWNDSSRGANDFGITDVDGFDFDTLGGTMLSDQFNFVVRFTGTIQHPGGTFGMQEEDDAVEDAVWAFVGDDVGSDRTEDLFLEVHGWAGPDATDDTVERSIPAGDVPVEIILIRCNEAYFSGGFVGDRPMEAQMSLGGGGYRAVGEQPSTSEINTTFFPPAS